MTKEEYESILTGNFVLFRFRYNELSFEQHLEIADAWDEKWPIQRQYNLDGLKHGFSILKEDLYIVELGAHDGSLGLEILGNYGNIISWNGYDICSKAISRSYTSNRYKPILLKNWFHNIKLPFFNTFLSSHTLEHLSDDRVLATFDKVSIAKYLILDTPLEEYGQDWAGYHASHVLKSGKRDLDRWLEERGFNKLKEITETMSIWENKKKERI